MTSLARSRGGRCLSALYLNASTHLLWECAKGHRWNAVPGSIRKGTWCPECAGVRPGTLEQMVELARSRGGRCLSERYTNTATKLEWRCYNGHQWRATPLQVKKGHWIRLHITHPDRSTQTPEELTEDLIDLVRAYLK